MRRLLNPLFWLCALLFLGYMALVLSRPQGVFWSLDEGGKLLYIQNVLAANSARAPLAYPGRALDPLLEHIPLLYVARAGDQLYSWWPVGFPLLTLPYYRLLGWGGLYVLPALAGAAAAGLSALIAARLLPAVQGRSRTALLLLTAAVVGAATPVLFYATMFWEHTLSVALLLLGLWLALRSGQEACGSCAWAAGAAVALGGFLRTEQLFAGLGILAVLFAWRPRLGLRMGAALLAVMTLWMAFNWSMMGSWISRQWGEGSGELGSSLFPGLLEAGALYVPYLLFNAPKIIAFDLGAPLLWAGTLFLAACVLLPGLPRLWPLLVGSYVGLAAVCALVLFHPQGYRSLHGLVLAAPHIVCFAWLYRAGVLRKANAWPMAMVSAAVLFVLCAYVARSWLAAGGQQWGPRYLLVLYPLLTAAAAAGLAAAVWGLSRTARRTLLPAIALLVLVGVGFQVRGQWAVWTTVQNYQATRAALQAADRSPKLTDCVWLPMVIPELYWRGDIYARHGDHQDPLAWEASLRALGAENAQWLAMDLCAPIPLDQIQQGRAANPSGVTIEPLNRADY